MSHFRIENNDVKLSEIDFSPNANKYDTNYTYEVTDDIKNAYNSDEVTFNKKYYYENIYNIYMEYDNFYSSNIKTGLLQSTNQIIADNIIDSNTTFTNLNDEIITSNTIITLEHLEQIIKDVNLFGETGLLVTISQGKYSVIVIKPKDYIKTQDGRKTKVEIEYIKDNKLYKLTREYYYNVKIKRYNVKDTYEELYDSNVPNNDVKKRVVNFTSAVDPFYIVNGSRLFLDGAIELSLIYSSTWTSLYKDIATGASQLFIDEQYSGKGDRNTSFNNKRLAFIPISTPLSAMGDNKPLFEHISPSIRSTEHGEIISQIESRLANIMNVSSSMFSSSSSATDSVIIDSKTAKRFNKTKRLIMNSLNQFLKDYNVKINIVDYKNETKEFQIKNAVLLQNNKISTQKPFLSEIYNNKSDEWIEEEYLRTEIKNERKLTLDESLRAVELGLISSVDDLNGTGSQGTEALTGEHQVENADKVNVQGVAVPVDEQT